MTDLSDAAAAAANGELLASTMSKRERFAMAAMEGLLAHYGSSMCDYSRSAHEAVVWADALLEALQE
jgi:hypothetical protein